MILLLDTSTPLCRLTTIDGETIEHREWQADRQLAKGLLKWLTEQLNEFGYTLKDINGIGAYQGPGSFTGLRIGLTVLNTLADGLAVPIVAARGQEWQTTALNRLSSGENDRVVLPYYDREAIITKPRK